MRLITPSIPLAFLVVACTGTVPGDDGDDIAPTPDGAPAPLMVTVSGMTMDYFTDTVALGTTTLAIEGVQPPVNHTSDAAGLYSVLIEPGTTAVAIASRPNYRVTRNAAILTGAPDMPMMENLYVGSAVQVQNFYLNAIPSVIETVDSAVAVTDLKRNNGMPLEGVPIADVSLVDNAVPPAIVPGVVIRFLNVDGNFDQNLITSTAFLGRARVGVLNCPPGSFNLKVLYIDGQGLQQTYTVATTCEIDGFTLGRTGGGGGGGGMQPMTPTFNRDIYPILQLPSSPQATAYSSACTGCHNTTRLAPNGPQCVANPAVCVPIAYDGLAPDVYAAIMARSQVAPKIVDLIAPADSMLLTKPLYELVGLQNHPNATFPNVQDDRYKMIMLWIQQGATMGL